MMDLDLTITSEGGPGAIHPTQPADTQKAKTTPTGEFRPGFRRLLERKSDTGEEIVPEAENLVAESEGGKRASKEFKSPSQAPVRSHERTSDREAASEESAAVETVGGESVAAVDERQQAPGAALVGRREKSSGSAMALSSKATEKEPASSQPLTATPLSATHAQLSSPSTTKVHGSAKKAQESVTIASEESIEEQDGLSTGPQVVASPSTSFVQPALSKRSSPVALSTSSDSEEKTQQSVQKPITSPVSQVSNKRAALDGHEPKNLVKGERIFSERSSHGFFQPQRSETTRQALPATKSPYSAPEAVKGEVKAPLTSMTSASYSRKESSVSPLRASFELSASEQPQDSLVVESPKQTPLPTGDDEREKILVASNPQEDLPKTDAPAKTPVNVEPARFSDDKSEQPASSEVPQVQRQAVQTAQQAPEARAFQPTKEQRVELALSHRRSQVLVEENEPTVPVSNSSRQERREDRLVVTQEPFAQEHLENQAGQTQPPTRQERVENQAPRVQQSAKQEHVEVQQSAKQERVENQAPRVQQSAKQERSENQTTVAQQPIRQERRQPQPSFTPQTRQEPRQAAITQEPRNLQAPIVQEPVRQERQETRVSSSPVATPSVASSPHPKPSLQSQAALNASTQDRPVSKQADRALFAAQAKSDPLLRASAKEFTQTPQLPVSKERAARTQESSALRLISTKENPAAQPARTLHSRDQVREDRATRSQSDEADDVLFDDRHLEETGESQEPLNAGQFTPKDPTGDRKPIRSLVQERDFLEGVVEESDEQIQPQNVAMQPSLTPAAPMTPSMEVEGVAPVKDMSALIEEISAHIMLMSQKELTETTITLSSNSIFNGAQILIRQHRLAAGEFTVSFHNLGDMAAHLISNRLNQSSLRMGFVERGYNVHVLQVTQSPLTQTYFTSDAQSGNFRHRGHEGGDDSGESFQERQERRRRG